MGFSAGKLKFRVKLQRLAGVVRNALNEPVENWATLGEPRADMTEVSDAERLRSSEMAASIDRRFEIRWSAKWADLNPKDRLIFDGFNHNIVGVKTIGTGSRPYGLEISALSRADKPG